MKDKLVDFLGTLTTVKKIQSTYNFIGQCFVWWEVDTKTRIFE